MAKWRARRSDARSVSDDTYELATAVSAVRDSSVPRAIQALPVEDDRLQVGLVSGAAGQRHVLRAMRFQMSAAALRWHL